MPHGPPSIHLERKQSHEHRNNRDPQHAEVAQRPSHAARVCLPCSDGQEAAADPRPGGGLLRHRHRRRKVSRRDRVAMECQSRPLPSGSQSGDEGPDRPDRLLQDLCRLLKRPGDRAIASRDGIGKARGHGEDVLFVGWRGRGGYRHQARAPVLAGASRRAAHQNSVTEAGLSRGGLRRTFRERPRPLPPGIRAAAWRLLPDRDAIHLPQHLERGGPGEVGEALPEALEREILYQGADTVAAFIAEPVQGAGGLIVPHESYWPMVREICESMACCWFPTR